MNWQPLVELTRGGIVESLHSGALAIADAQGRLVAAWGDPNAVCFLRSSAKPFQALAMVESGAALAFGLSPREIALTCASHKGMDMHADAARSIQVKIGASEADLLCGTHEPDDSATARRLLRAGEEPTPNRHNCSGKHSGMLALARHLNLPLADYINPSHPIQQRILRAVADMCALQPANVVIGVDGCSAPNFAVPLVNAATAFARLADPGSLAAGACGDDWPAASAHRRATALHTIFDAMTSHPEMVSGPGSFTTELMRRRPDQLVAKGGAEAYFGMGLTAGALAPGSPALGITFKVADGAARAVPVVALEVLRQLGLLDEADFKVLDEAGFGPRQTLRNYMGLEVGETRAVFTLRYADGR